MEEENKAQIEEISYTTNPLSTSSINKEESTSDKIEKTIPEVNEEFVKPKKRIIFKVLIGVISLLLLIIITGSILYFTGFFEHKEEIPKEETQHTEAHAEITPPIVEKPQVKEEGYKFNIKDINSKKLNDQLASLTNKNIEKKEEDKKPSTEVKKETTQIRNNEDELIKEKAELEKQKQELEKQKIEQDKIKTENTSEKKDNSSSTQENKNINTENIVENRTIVKEEKNKENEFLLLINVVKIKGVLYKKYLDKIIAINPNVKLCRDEKNRIEIYFGPFKNNEERSELLNKLIKNKFNEAYELELTKIEFDKRCNY